MYTGRRVTETWRLLPGPELVGGRKADDPQGKVTLRPPFLITDDPCGPESMRLSSTFLEISELDQENGTLGIDPDYGVPWRGGKAALCGPE